MDWQDLLLDERYLYGTFACIHHLFVFPEIEIVGDARDFLWAKNPTMAELAIGPIQSFTLMENRNKFFVGWKWVDRVKPDFSRAGEEYLGFGGFTLDTGVDIEPRERGLLYLGTSYPEITEVYLIPDGFCFQDFIPKERSE